MPDLALTGEGLTVQTLAEVIAELQAAFKDPTDGYGPDFSVAAESPQGQLTAIFGREIADLQQMLVAVVTVLDKENAEGIFLDFQASLVGVERDEATFSTVALELGGTPATLIGAGKLVRHDPTGTIWAIDADATIGGGGTIAATATCTTSGPNEATTSAVNWTIVTPVSGWDTVESTADAVAGTDADGDPEVRTEMDGAVATLGKATPSSANANAQQDVAGITHIRILNNPSGSVVDGVPAYGMEAVVLGGDDQDILDFIFGEWAGGTPYGGSTSGTVTDATGDEHTVAFSRPTDVELYLRVTLDTTGAEVTLPAGSDAAVKAAIVAEANTLTPGKDAVPVYLHNVVLDTIPAYSITDLTVEVSDDGATWQTTPWAIAVRELARFDSSRTTVNVT